MNFKSPDIYNQANSTPVLENYYFEPVFSFNNPFSGFLNTDISSFSLFPFTQNYYPATCCTMFDSDLYFTNFAAPQSYYAPVFADLWQMPVFKMPEWLNFNKKSTNPYANNNYSFNTSTKYRSLLDAGYDSRLGARLARDVASHAQSHSTGYCARYVSNALARLGLSSSRGDAWQLKYSLRKNPNFKEVDVASVDVKKLPAGCILVYDKGAANYSSKYGHVEVTLGNGKAASDFVNSNIKKSSNMSVFVPVSA